MKKLLIMAATVFMLTGSACTLSTKSDDQKENPEPTGITVEENDSLANQVEQVENAN